MLRTVMVSVISAAAFAYCSIATLALAEDKAWWPLSVVDWSSGSSVPTNYVPLEKASKKWHLCVLVPHMKDSWWVAFDYGIVEEAKRLGVKVTVFEAGGYTNLAKQIDQFDDCVALGVAAILSSVISEEGLTPKITEGREQGIIQIGAANQIFNAPVHAKVFADQELMGYTGGALVVDYFKGHGKVIAVHFAGPQASGWAEHAAAGFRRASEGSNIVLLEEKFGDTGKSVQLKLVEDALQTYDDVQLLYGVGVMGEVAVGAVDDAGLLGKTNISVWYTNEAILDFLLSGDIIGTVTQAPVTLARMCVDLAVRALEGKDYMTEVHPTPQPITKNTINNLDLTSMFAPKGWRPQFSVE